jgi:hypothetical protein
MHLPRARRLATAPTDLGPLTGFHRGVLPSGVHEGHPESQPLLRLLAPSTTTIMQVRFSRVCLTRHVPPAGFFAPSTVYSLPIASPPRRRQPFMGFL